MHSRTARFRSAAVAACMSFVALFLFLVALPFQPLGRPKHFFIHRVLRRWCQLLLKLLGIHVMVSGKEFLAAQNRIVVSNHASWLDIPILIASFPGQLRIIGKKELGSWPLVGWYIKLAGHFLLDRNNDRQGRQVIRAAAAALRTYGVSILIFPEGTTTADGFLQKFRNSFDNLDKLMLGIGKINLSLFMLEPVEIGLLQVQAFTMLRSPFFKEQLAKDSLVGQNRCSHL